MWTEGGVECRHFSGHLETEKRERGVANEGQKGTRGQVPGERERAKGGGEAAATKNAALFI